MILYSRVYTQGNEDEDVYLQAIQHPGFKQSRMIPSTHIPLWRKDVTEWQGLSEATSRRSSHTP